MLWKPWSAIDASIISACVGVRTRTAGARRPSGPRRSTCARGATSSAAAAAAVARSECDGYACGNVRAALHRARDRLVQDGIVIDLGRVEATRKIGRHVAFGR